MQVSRAEPTWRVVYAGLSLVLGAALVFAWLLLSRPSAGWLLAIAAAGLVALRFPGLWLAVVVSLIAVIDRTPYTGNGLVPESTALVGAMLVALAIRIAWQRLRPPTLEAPDAQLWRPQWGAGGKLIVMLLAFTYVIAVFRGINGVPQWNATSLAFFTGDAEVFRVASGPLLALWCLPLLRMSPPPLRNLPLAACLSLLLIATIVLLERLSFTDLTDFSSDYRTTGPFWEMHVGGAALDAMLMLTFPFALWIALRGKGWQWLGVLAALLGAYAVLVGFTRSTYLALVVEVIVLAAAITMRSTTATTTTFRSHLPLLILLALTAGGMLLSFPTSGYRGLMGLVGVFACVWLVGGTRGEAPLARTALLALVGAAVLFASGAIWEQLWSKAVYAQIPLAVVLCFGAVLWPSAGSTPWWRKAIAMAAAVWCGVTTVRLATYWGGNVATTPMAIAVSGLGALWLVTQLRTQSPWQASLKATMPVAACAVTVAMAVSVFSNHYISHRFGTVSQDMQGRLIHWRSALSVLDTPAEYLLGVGSGQFAKAYRWQSSSPDLPGDYQLIEDSGLSYLRLHSPRQAMTGSGEQFRVNQRIDVDHLFQPATLTFKARVPRRAALFLELCRKHLIYATECAGKYVELKETDQWQTITWPIKDAKISRGPWYHHRPLALSFAAGGGIVVDVADIELTDANGASLVHNGDFRDGLWRWFPSSDKHHLPWHAKNAFLHVLIEQGLLGLAIVTLALTAAVIRLVARAREHPLAAPLLAGLVGMTVVGLFDSVLDAPRLGFVFVLWMAIALSLPFGKPKHPPA